MEIYLIRHGEIAGDPHRHYEPPVEGCLSERGCEQASRLAEALREIPFTALYASPLGRAIQTAQPLAEMQNLPIRVLTWLIEWRPAAALGTCDEANYEEMERAAAALRPEQSWKTAAGESTFEMANRVIPGFLELLETYGIEAGHGGYLFKQENTQQRIALFAHGGSLGQLAAFLLGVPLSPFSPVVFAMTGVAIFSFTQRAEVWYPTLKIPQPYQE